MNVHRLQHSIKSPFRVIIRSEDAFNPLPRRQVYKYRLVPDLNRSAADAFPYDARKVLKGIEHMTVELLWGPPVERNVFNSRKEGTVVRRAVVVPDGLHNDSCWAIHVHLDYPSINARTRVGQSYQLPERVHLLDEIRRGNRITIPAGRPDHDAHMVVIKIRHRRILAPPMTPVKGYFSRPLSLVS